MTFKIHLGKEPTGTAQQKGVTVVGHKPRFYEKPEVQAQRMAYFYAMKPYRPKKPLTGPVSLQVTFVYPQRKSGKMAEAIIWKPTMPDLDNLLKLFVDTMTMCKFWEDDRQIVNLEARKIIAKGKEDFEIIVSVSEVDDESQMLIEETWGVFHYD